MTGLALSPWRVGGTLGLAGAFAGHMVRDLPVSVTGEIICAPKVCVYCTAGHRYLAQEAFLISF